MPVYLVENTPDGTPRLVNAKTPAAAIKHVIGDDITARHVTTSEMADMIGAGMAVEKAKAPESDNAPVVPAPVVPADNAGQE